MLHNVKNVKANSNSVILPINSFAISNCFKYTVSEITALFPKFNVVQGTISYF